MVDCALVQFNHCAALLQTAIWEEEISRLKKQAQQVSFLVCVYVTVSDHASHGALLSCWKAQGWRQVQKCPEGAC